MKQKYCGLLNKGNACYVNAVVQALFHSHTIRKYILNLPQNLSCHRSVFSSGRSYSTTNSEEYLLAAIQQLFFQLCYSNETFLDPEEVLKSLGYSDSKALTENDANETFKYILDKLETVIRSKNQKSLFNNFKGIFMGTISNYLYCSNCEKENGSQENFIDILIPIKSSIFSSLASLIRPEIINDYRCKIC